jgi:hypothetical protein
VQGKKPAHSSPLEQINPKEAERRQGKTSTEYQNTKNISEGSGKREKT